MYKKSSDKVNEIYAAGSFWLEHTQTPRLRLHKQASALGAALGGVAGAGAGYLTSDEKSNVRKRLTRAGLGGILGAGAGYGLSKLRNTSSDAKSLSISEAFSRVDTSKLNPKEKAAVNRLRKLFPKTASAQAAIVGGIAMGAYGGLSTYLKHRRKPGQQVSEAEFAARSRKDYLDTRQQKGLKVSILDRKLNQMALRDAQESKSDLGMVVAKGAVAGATTGAAAGFLAAKAGA